MNKWDIRFLDLAKLVSIWSKDPSTQTGAVIVTPENRVVSVGFNGFPQAMHDDPALYEDRTEKLSRIIHCEMNALIFADKVPLWCTLYTYPFISCDRCIVHMIQAGIYKFVAPKPTPEKEERWGESFKRTRQYVQECHGQIEEVDYV